VQTGTVNSGTKPMKQLLLISALFALIFSGGCTKDKDDQPAGPDNKVMVEEIFKAGMAWDNEARALKSTYPVNIDVETYQYGVEGGYIHVLGSVTGNMTFDDNTGQMTGGVLLLGLTESVVNYTFECENEIYTMNGAPYLSLAGTFTLMPGNTYASASTMSIGGGVQVTGPDGYDQTINIQISILIYADGSGGRVSGTINGEDVDFMIGG
jgi:hypothetical protein